MIFTMPSPPHEVDVKLTTTQELAYRLGKLREVSAAMAEEAIRDAVFSRIEWGRDE